MKISLLTLLVACLVSYHSVWGTTDSIPTKTEYLREIKNELQKKWPNNRTINLVFHGHSVPAGYFKTPVVNTLDAYPYQVLKELKKRYPLAVINVINTAIGGENSISGQNRFESEVLTHKPDVLLIDYGLNDRRAGLEEARKAWVKMIESAKQEGIKVILLTPSPDLSVILSDKESELEKHAHQIKALAMRYEVGLVASYSLFKQLQEDCDCVADYMSQINHPNARGHGVIASGIMNYF